MKLWHLVFALVLVASCSFADKADATIDYEEDGDNSQATETVLSKEPEEYPGPQRQDEDTALPESSALASEDSQLGYRMPGLFGFNGGEPFYLEKDPVTGAVDFNTKTSPVQRKEDNVDTEEYFYEDEEDTGDGIDRRDGGFAGADIGRPNHFSPYVNDVNARIVNHKYDTNNKFPLISSSYANTKIQGTGAESHKYNHKPYVTSSTQSPSYYTIRPPRPTYVNPPRITTTTSQPLHENDSEYSESTSLKNPISTDSHRTKPEENSAAEGNLKQEESASKGTEYFKPTTTPSKPSDTDDYYEDEYDSDSGTEFKLSDLFGYGQTSQHDRPQQQGNTHYNTNYDQVPAASFENSYQNTPVVENDRIKGVQENVYIVTSTEKTIQSNEKHNTETNQPQLTEQNHPDVQVQKAKDQYNHSHATNDTKTSNQAVSENKHQEQFVHLTAQGEKLADTNSNRRPVVVVVPSSTPSTTPFVGIIYSESEKPNVATSMPLGTHFQYTTPKPVISFETHTRPTIQHQDIQPSKHDSSFTLSSQLGASQSASKPVNLTPSAPFSSNIVKNPYGSYAEEPFRPIFGPGNLVIKEAELPRPQQQPLIGPPPVKNANTITTVAQETSVVPVRQQLPSKIPEETPTRWNYPYREGSSQYFQLPKQQQQQQQQQQKKQQQQPPRFPGIQPPNPNIKPAQFAAGVQDHKVNSQISAGASELFEGASKPILNQDSTTQTPSVPHQNLDWYNKNYEKKVNAGLDFASGDNAVETTKITLESGIQFSSENDFTNDKTNQQQSNIAHGPEDLGGFRVPPVPDQRRPPPLTRPSPLPPKPSNLPYAIQEPAQDLRPPANPEISRVGSQQFPRPHWESRPSNPQKLIPQSLPPVPQTARPKQDIAPTYFGQAPGNRPRPGVPPPAMLQGNRMHFKNTPNQDPRLPNILPQFRPNAKISHGHSDTEGKIPADSYFGQLPRQPYLDRPGRRPQAELTEHLQPPPPSNYRRINRNEDPAVSGDIVDVEDVFHFEKDPPPPPPAVVQQKPLVHRRTGPHYTNSENAPVATLQMMQQHQQLLVGNKHHLGRPLAARDDFPDKYEGDDVLKPPYHVTYPVGSNLEAEASEKRPVFVVYPVNSASLTSDSATTDNSAIVMGTRGPNRPVPPSNLPLSDDFPEAYSLEENPLALPYVDHKDQKPLLQLPSDRLDAPVLKVQNHANSVKPIKTEFPYPLEPPAPIENDKYEIDRKYSIAGNETDFSSKSNKTFSTGEQNNRKEMFSIFDDIPAEVHNSNIDRNEDNDGDTEINIIPYLQDYMPFATKKPIANPKPVHTTTPASTNSIAVDSTSRPQKPWPSPTYEPHRSSSAISVTLKTVQPTKLVTAATTEHPKLPSSWLSTKSDEEKQREKISGSEFTVSAVMHTHQNNHRPAVEESTTSPPQLNFQAPFLASENIASAPTNKGWSVISNSSPAREEPKQSTDKDKVSDEQPEVLKTKSDPESSDPSNFDFENFRPQLFGGFKPIYSFPTKEVDERSRFTTEREEKMI